MADHRAEDVPLPPPRKSHRASDADRATAGANPHPASGAEDAPGLVTPAEDAPNPVTPAELGPRRRRRVTTPPPAGSDPSPVSEAPRHRASENDQRLRADKPPHWG